MYVKAKPNKYPLLLTMLLSLTLLTACGGSSNPKGLPSKSVSTGPSWVKDQFQSSSNFVAQCEDPRVGSSPITGEVYPDKKGSELFEKHWQRAFTNETYLWYKEVIDKDPKNFNLVDYFAQLKTMAVTDSGRDKDQFHWLQPTSEVEELTQLGVSYGYGISFDKQQSTSPRQWIVKNITPDTQAFTSGVSRGSILLEVDGVDFVNSDNQTDKDIINNAISSKVEGETHTFKFIDNNETEYQIELQTAAITGVPLQIAKTIETAQGKTGYLLLDSFFNSTVEKDLFDTFTAFAEQNISDLIVDLRYNGGGYLALSSQLAYMVAGNDATVGKVYEKTVYNDKISDEQTPFYRETLDLRRLIGGDSIIQAGRALPALNLNRVYVLTTGSSCSASESFMNALIGIDIEVIQIGTTTCGKPFGFRSEDNCGSTYFTVQFKGENDVGFGDYADGLMPVKLPEAGKLSQVQGCPISEDYQHNLGDEQEVLLASALYYQANNDCPDVAEKPARKMRTSSSKSIYSAEEAKLIGKSPLQDAIIRDIYFDKYRQLKPGNQHVN
jgi:C-terminal processing protease CtpA/Prc